MPAKTLDELRARMRGGQSPSLVPASPSQAPPSPIPGPTQPEVQTRSTVDLMSAQDRLDEIEQHGADPKSVGLKPSFSKDGEVQAYIDEKTGKPVAFKNFKTGGFLTRAPTAEELWQEGAIRSLPKPLQGPVRAIEDAGKAEVLRFGAEALLSGQAGMYARAPRAMQAVTSALRNSPRLAAAGRGVLPLAAEGAGAAAGSLASEPFAPSDRPLYRAAEVGGASFVGAGLGDVIGGLYGKVRRGGSTLEPDAIEAIQTLESIGAPLPTPGRLSRSRVLDIVETGAEASFAGGGRIVGRNEQSQAVVQAAMDDYVERLTQGANKVDLEEAIVNTINDRADVWRETANQLYRRLDGLKASGVVVTDVVDEALDIARKNRIGVESPEVSNVVRSVLKHYRKALTTQGVDLAGMSDEQVEALMAQRIAGGETVTVPWETASILRSNWLGIGRPTGEQITGQGQGVSRKLAGMLDDEMDAAAHSLDPALRDTWRAANEHWKEGADVFDSMFIKSLANADPDLVFQKAISQNKPDRIRRLRMLMLDTSNAPRVRTSDPKARQYPRRSPQRARPGGAHTQITTLDQARAEIDRLNDLARRTSNPATRAEHLARVQNLEGGVRAWEGIQGSFLREILSKSVKAGDSLNPLSLTATSKTLPRRTATSIRAKLDSYGEEALGEIFPDAAQRTRFDRLVRALDVTQREAGKNIPGRVAVQLNQAGAVYAGLTGDPLAATVVFGAPWIAARVLTNEKFIRHMLIANRFNVAASREGAAHWASAMSIAIAQGATYTGDDPKLLKQQATRDQNYGPGSPRIGSKTPSPTANRTATP